MDKKAYITPEVEEMNIETVEMMATSNADTFFISDDITEDDAKMGRLRRDVQVLRKNKDLCNGYCRNSASIVTTRCIRLLYSFDVRP